MPYPCSACRGNKVLTAAGGPNHLLNSLVAYWAGDLGSFGVLVDYHKNNLSMTKSGTVTEGTGLVYDSVPQYGSGLHYLDDNPLIDTGSGVSFTLAAWVKFNEVPFFKPTVIAKHSPNPDYREIQLNCGSSPGRQAGADFSISIDGAIYTYVSAAISSPDDWFLLVAWFNATNYEIGLQVNADTPVTVTTDASCKNGIRPLSIGGRYGSMGYENLFPGRIGPVAFWRSTDWSTGGALNANQRAALYNKGQGLRYDRFKM